MVSGTGTVCFAVIKELSNKYLGSIKPERMIKKKIKLENQSEDGVKTLIRDKDNKVKVRYRSKVRVLRISVHTCLLWFSLLDR